MFLEIEKKSIILLVCKQVENLFSIDTEEVEEIKSSLDSALAACEENFLNSESKYYVREIGGKKDAYFNPFHSVQWMTFLYYLGHLIYKKGSTTKICDKLYYLNKVMNGMDMFYAIEMPSHFGAEHPVGSVMGRAQYSDGFFFYQGCTVGGTRDKEGNLYYPVIEENVRMYANSSILGRCHIGRNVQIGAGALVKNQDVLADSVVFGQSPNLIIKERK